MPTPQAVLLTTPSDDFHDFLAACKEALEYSVAREVEQSSRKMSHAETVLWLLAAFQDRESKISYSLPSHLFPFVSCSVVVFADVRDMLDIIEACSGMPFIKTQTKAHDVFGAVITGTLAQWHDAVLAGCDQKAELTVCLGFRRIYRLVKSKYGNLWSEYSTREGKDETLLLERKR